MGFTTVHRHLVEMFPQIDARLLKAVAIEHSKDADAAAEVVLTEILPYWSKTPSTSTSLLEDQSASNPRGLSDGDGVAEQEEEQSTSLRRRRIVVRRKDKNVVSSPGPSSVCEYPIGNNPLSASTESEELILLGIKPNPPINDVGGNGETIEVCAGTKSDESVSSNKGQDINAKVGPDCAGTETGAVNDSLTESKDINGPMATDRHVEVENAVAQFVPSPVLEHSPVAPESGFQSELGSNTSTNFEKTESTGSLDVKSMQENPSETGDYEDHSEIQTVVTRSGNICRIDLLEEIIENSKNNKKTLFLAMESVMNLMSEVELKEKAAEEAQVEAGRGGMDILIKVEELKQMLVHAKEANEMHAGEVFGEKSILATEARELQNRLLNLSEERDKSLAILDEMRQTLSSRLAAAEELTRAAEQEKLAKEESAKISLAEQEAVMEKVVQESKILRQEAEENSKLREFLMDRGCVVDSLQGEISVICQDVRLLKEKFDDRVPLSKSVSSSQTTCILASSASSVKSMASIVAEECQRFETPKKMSPSPSTDDLCSVKSRPEDENIGAEHKDLLEDGWDFLA